MVITCQSVLNCELQVITCLFLTVFQLNISFPATGCQKLIEVDDERKLRTFYEKRMATEVPADPLGDEWKVSISVTCCDLFRSDFSMSDLKEAARGLEFDML